MKPLRRAQRQGTLCSIVLTCARRQLGIQDNCLIVNLTGNNRMAKKKKAIRGKVVDFLEDDCDK